MVMSATRREKSPAGAFMHKRVPNDIPDQIEVCERRRDRSRWIVGIFSGNRSEFIPTANSRSHEQERATSRVGKEAWVQL